MSRRAIAVFGSSSPTCVDYWYRRVRDFGEMLALAGFDVINGGHEGLMAAASEGCRAGGGKALGVTCASIRTARGAEINPYLHEMIDAPSLLTRIEIMMRRASGYVVFPGGSGTLAEIAVVWEHMAKGLIVPRPFLFDHGTWTTVILEMELWAGGSCNCRTNSLAEIVDVLRKNAIELPESERNYTAGKDIVRVNE